MTLWTHLALASLLVSTPALRLGAQTTDASAPPGIIRPFSEIQFPGPDSVCFHSFNESGDRKTGPSTMVFKAKPGCVVPPHFHTAVEQLMVVKGALNTGMDGMTDRVLGPGDFAMMPSKHVHWFTCGAKEECIAFVSFDRIYDVTFLKAKP